jgi:hypothetical protein
MVDRRQDMRNMDPPPPGSTERDREVIRLRNHYLGLSGASRMGFSAEAGDYYAAEVARDCDVLAGDGALVDRVLGELRRLDGIATLRCGGDPQPLRRVA